MTDIVFACGARYVGVKEIPESAHTRADGSFRLCVYDSYNAENPTTPKYGDGTSPRCYSTCPAKGQESSRKKTRCFPPEVEEEESTNGPTAWRWIVTCYAKKETQP